LIVSNETARVLMRFCALFCARKARFARAERAPTIKAGNSKQQTKDARTPTPGRFVSTRHAISITMAWLKSMIS
jgi:hypothetical protein